MESSHFDLKTYEGCYDHMLPACKIKDVVKLRFEGGAGSPCICVVQALPHCRIRTCTPQTRASSFGRSVSHDGATCD